MLILRFFHDDNLLLVGDKKYKATCPVRNELNEERKPNQLVKTFPLNSEEEREYYFPRKYPTGIWRVLLPVWTKDKDYAPVKIPTTAVRTVFIYDERGGKYNNIIGVQEDAFYHLHFAEESYTTLGCIRLNSAIEAKEIAKMVEKALKKEEEVFIEVLASRDCNRG